MPVEAELTAVVQDPDCVRAALADRADPEHSTYADTYYDRPDNSLDADGYELRVRTVTTGESTRILLTFKEPAVDDDSGSKPEHETEIGSAKVVDTILTRLGLVELISFEKHCDNYRFAEGERELLATVVQIPELDGLTFIELETIAEQDDVSAALQVVRDVLGSLGVAENDLTTESYTDRVAARRKAS
jgi:adenylate cyclase class 2